MNAVPGWIPTANAKGEWMQIDLGEERDVAGVVTQARGNNCCGPMGVTSFTVLPLLCTVSPSDSGSTPPSGAASSSPFCGQGGELAPGGMISGLEWRCERDRREVVRGCGGCNLVGARV